MLNRTYIFDAVRAILLRPEHGGKTFTPIEIHEIDLAFDKTEAEMGQAAAVVVTKASSFVLSQLSLSRLKGVKAELVTCVKLAITLTTTDFRVQQGVRTLEEQKAAVAAGNSRTMNSRHLPQKDGFAWAVDLLPLVNGQPDQVLDVHYADVAYAMDQAATKLGFSKHIRWGCAWDRVLSDFGGNPAAYLAEAKAYAARHAGSDLLDGPHFEWVP